jgi:hypothetical protein
VASAGDILTADVYNRDTTAVRPGSIYRVTNASATSGTTELAVITTGTVALEVGAAYEVELFLLWNNSVANDDYNARIRDTNVAGTQRAGGTLRRVAGAFSAFDTLVYPFTAAASTGVWCGTVQRAAGTGVCTALAGTRLYVRRLGPAGSLSTV